MKMNKIGYFADFILLPTFVILFTVFAFHSPAAPSLTIWAATYVIGLFSWTLLEYLLHRVVFHSVPIISDIHARHHKSPHELIGTPAWVSLLSGLFGVAYPSEVALGFGLATAATAGVATGYLWYVFVHYAAHQWQHSGLSYLYRVRARHAYHHHKSGRKNFGVTTSFWDHVFGTAFKLNASVSPGIKVSN